MTKMLVCDFDDTVKTSSKYITHLNFDAIKRFKKNGNKLVFASGRTFNSLNKSLSNYNCPYDALVCNDGNVGFDSNNDVVYANEISNNDVLKIMYYLYNKYDKLIYDVDLYDYFGYTKQKNNIIEMVAITKLLKSKRYLLDELSELFPSIEFKLIRNFLHIRRKNNKSYGVKEISSLFGIEKENIYTVGDFKNDYEMIRDYNGYNVLLSHPKLYKVSNGTVLNVAHLVKKLENK